MPVSRPSGFRADIEGLRAIAIILVLLYHAGFSFAPGGFVGLDVFFVISGFLITGLILREIASTGRLSPTSFYARRAKRLLPAAVLVLITTAVLAYFFLPITQRTVFGGDIAAASAYVVNWVLAARSVDYLAEGIAASPVQHFWSLAVEEQFYIVWPLAVVALLWRAHRAGARVHRVLAIGIACIVVPSFIWSVYLTDIDPGRAYFVTTTRLWELGIGAAVALTVTFWARAKRPVAELMMALGLALIVASALLLDASTPWPSWRALLPVVGAAFVVAGGAARHATVSATLLGARPMVWVGGLSYSLYLWHWPLIVAAGSCLGGLTTLQGSLAVLAAFAPAWLSHHYIENPIRHAARLKRGSRPALVVGALCVALGLGAGGSLAFTGSVLADTRPAGLTVRGDAALEGHDLTSPWDASAETGPFLPSPALATKDVPAVYDDECQVNDASVATCTYGDDTADRTVVLVGDSMATQWQPALDLIGRKYGFRGVTYLKSSCTFTTAVLQNRGEVFESCTEWNSRVMPAILDLKLGVVVTTHGSTTTLTDPQDPASTSVDAMIKGLSDTWTLVDASSEVVVITKNPVPPVQMPSVPRSMRATSTRAHSRSTRRPPTCSATAAQVPGVAVMSRTDRICPGGSCPAVIGDALLYRQGAHLTKTWVLTGALVLEERPIDAVPLLALP